MDILGGAASAVADDLLGSITGVVNLFLSGKCPSQLGEYIACAPLTPLVKPGGGIRPIAVGTVWQRLVSKAVLHSVNRLVESKGNEVGFSMLLVDFSNAFNLVDMSVLLEESRVQCLSIAPWTINQLCKLTLHAWYLNDGTIVGDTLMVAKALDIIKTKGPARGLFLNVDKTEIFWPVEDHRSRTEGVFPINISRPLNGVKLLGGSVSLDEGFCQDLALKNVSKTISLMEAAQVQFDQALRDSLEKVVIALGPGFGDWQWRLATLPIKLGGIGILSAGDIFQYTCIRSLHVQDFLFTIPIDGLGQRMNHRQFRSVLCYRFLVPMFTECSLCPSCNAHQMDQWGDHAVHCCSEVGVKFRHNLVRDILVDICSKVGIMVRKEAPMGFLSHDGKDLRPADLLLFNWLQGKDVCLDVTGIYPFAGTGANSWAPGVALHNAVEKKKRKYASICVNNGYKFIPFAFSTFGEFDTEALDTLSLNKAISISHSNNAKSGAFIFHRVGFCIQKGVGAQLVSRLPSNFIQAKAVKDLSRPAGKLRPQVHGQTLKYNMKLRECRGISLEELMVDLYDFANLDKYDGRIGYEEFQVRMKEGTDWRKVSLGKCLLPYTDDDYILFSTDGLPSPVSWLAVTANICQSSVPHPIGKLQMSPVEIIIFAAVMPTIGAEGLMVKGSWGNQPAMKEQHRPDAADHPPEQFIYGEVPVQWHELIQGLQLHEN
nr:putative reverse transcriptase domain-containing protein [Tanacetum cinerariifolium]